MTRILMVGGSAHLGPSVMAKLNLGFLVAAAQEATSLFPIDGSQMFEIKAPECGDMPNYLMDEKGIGQKAKWASKPYKRKSKH